MELKNKKSNIYNSDREVLAIGHRLAVRYKKVKVCHWMIQYTYGAKVSPLILVTIRV